jgi:membrane-associated phospholipid phosphatase
MYVIRKLWQVVRLMSHDSIRMLVVHRTRFALAAGGVALAVVLCLPFDPLASRWIDDRASEPLIELAKGIRVWGDFIDTVVISCSVFLLGGLLRNRRMQLAAIACFTAAVVAGLSANVVRFSSGRPRPNAELPDRLHGPTFNYRLQSFPSGHCSTSTGGAVALAVAFPPLAAPVLANSAALAWASFYTRRHYVTDVLVGIAWGSSVGLLYGCAARRLSRRIRRRDEQPVLGGGPSGRVRFRPDDHHDQSGPSANPGDARSSRAGPVAAWDGVPPPD